ncbi:MAG: flagellar protein FlbB [Spirochaeta sp.]|jgi:flagellar protein FlbB|nr:flagellar protein FlbB [Spirochaeta sp.]
MAVRYSKIGALPQIILLIFLLLGLIAGGLIWFDYLGLVDVKDRFAPVLGAVGVDERSQTPDPDDVMLMDRLRLEKLQEAIAIREAELEQARDGLSDERLTIEQEQQELQQRLEEVEEREVSLNERLQRYENRRAVLEQNSRDLTSMRPDDAVEILAGYDDQLLIDTLRVTEELARQAGEVSLVSVWLSRLPAERASDIQRKMTLKPVD